MTDSRPLVQLHPPGNSPRASVARVTPSPRLIHRDIALDDAPFTAPELFATDDSDRLAPLCQITLAALALPAVAYSLTQLWSLVSGDTLHHAIRAFFP